MRGAPYPPSRACASCRTGREAKFRTLFLSIGALDNSAFSLKGSCKYNHAGSRQVWGQRQTRGISYVAFTKLLILLTNGGMKSAPENQVIYPITLINFTIADSVIERSKSPFLQQFG